MSAREIRSVAVRRGAALLASVSLLAGLAAASEAAQICEDLDPEVQQTLQAMADSARRVNYSGVVTLQRGGDMQIMELSHRVDEHGTTEALARLTGQDARVQRLGHPADCQHPGHQLLRPGPSLESGVCSLSLYYRFRVGPGERIAGRDALRLRIEPRDMYRFGYIFELDRGSALMLKSTTLGADQRVLEQFQFASLSLSAPVGDGSDTGAAVQHQAQHPHPDESENLRAGPAWEIAWLPSGFLATDAAPVESQRKSYTDGLSSFSVFLEPLVTAIKPGEGVERQGSTVAYTRGVVLRSRPVLVTVLGEIPTNTARMVADSVRMR
ncbi:MAG: sigma-E factor negative regulatory protein RseB [Halieaceae bacterium]